MINFKIRYTLLLFAACISLQACKKAWQDHTAITIEALNKTLIQQINETPDLSTFSTYLVKTGYDKVLASSKSYTVWAPTNTAMQTIDAAILADTAKLRLFVANHISYQEYFTTAPNPSLVIRTLSGKNIIFTPATFEEAKIVKGNVYVKNGVLHTIDQASGTKQNAYEFMMSTGLSTKQRGFIQSLFHTEIDTSKGVKLYTDPITKKTIYQAGTTFPVTKNTYFQRVSDISSEDSLLTYIILSDVAYDAEKAKIGRYYNLSTSATKTDTLTQFAVVKDLVVNHVYTIDNLPDTLTTVSGVKIHLDRSAIIQTQKLSNGIAYVVSSIGYQILQNKIPVIYIQGELPDSVRVPSTLSIRTKKDLNDVKYTDMQSRSITSSPDPLYYYRYKTTVNSAQYKVYWRAVNDIFTTSFNQKVDFSATRYYPKAVETPLATMGYKAVAVSDYSEVYLGLYTPANYGTLYTFLVSATGVVSTAPSALSLDYIKLVPVN
ncbi:beta-Ig-H3/fasciclin [Mucilaginibacter paludis DSM 18603]|uniref:Beta-Ig-H3/fasciclin n=2 Tax=Mucilaginibacter TaxID=423349 RepID=H1Y9V7_9SPHI|nr:beta-Ig-H3/fasciclin [Mucilaginibacter paludis DSM 18603]